MTRTTKATESVDESRSLHDADLQKQIAGSWKAQMRRAWTELRQTKI